MPKDCQIECQKIANNKRINIMVGITRSKVSADPGRRQGGARQGREGFGSQQQQQQQRGLQRQLQQQQQEQQEQQEQQQQQARQLQSFCSEQNPEGTSSLGAACFWRSFRPSVAWCFGVARGTLWRPAAPAPAAPPAAAAGNRRKK